MIFKNQEYKQYKEELTPYFEGSQDGLVVDDDHLYINRKELINQTIPEADRYEYESNVHNSHFEGMLEDVIPEIHTITMEYGYNEVISIFDCTAVVDGFDSDNVYFKVIYVEV